MMSDYERERREREGRQRLAADRASAAAAYRAREERSRAVADLARARRAAAQDEDAPGFGSLDAVLAGPYPDEHAAVVGEPEFAEAAERAEYPSPADTAVIARAPGSLEEYVTRRQTETERPRPIDAEVGAMVEAWAEMVEAWAERWPADAEFEAMTEESYRRASEAWAARCASGVLSPEQRRITQAEEMAD